MVLAMTNVAVQIDPNEHAREQQVVLPVKEGISMTVHHQ